ncbi:MAG: hypothetical protein ACREHE_09100 [Rhizomicrobium sp.]
MAERFQRLKQPRRRPNANRSGVIAIHGTKPQITSNRMIQLERAPAPGTVNCCRMMVGGVYASAISSQAAMTMRMARNLPFMPAAILQPPTRGEAE